MMIVNGATPLFTRRWTMRLACISATSGGVFLAASIGIAGAFAPQQPSAAQASTVSPYASRYLRPAAQVDPRHTPERELLGRTLFFDPRLSGSSWISCASCHNPGFSWGDRLPLALGHGMQTLGRRTPTLLNVAWAPALFWDGRASTLEEQALGPIQAAGEMNMPLPALEKRLREIEGYRTLFERAYPGQPISAETIGAAIATFERQIVSGEAPFDRWIAGDRSAISPEAQRGFALFNEKAMCSSCHAGWRFTDDSFHDIGVRTDDPGRGRLQPTATRAQFAFKTPTLRNVADRAPYYHNGSAATLEEVIELYDRGGLSHRPSLSAKMKPLGLSGREKQELVAFLLTLTSDDPVVSIPVLPR